MRIDPSVLTTVAICGYCNWRDTRPTEAAAWTALAIHLKAAHDDPHAVAKCRDAARKHRARHG